MSSEKNNFSLTALLIGVPVLVGASFYYFYSSRSKNDTSTGQEPNSKREQTELEQIMHLKQTGNQNFSRKNYDLAHEQYTKAIELSRNSSPPTQKPEDLAIFYQNRAACNEALCKYELVIDDCNRAIDLKKNYIKAYLRRAKVYEKLQQYDKAMVDAFSANLLDKFQNQSSMILFESIVKNSSKVRAAEAMKNHIFTWPSNQTIKNYFSAFACDPIKDRVEGEIKSSNQLQPLFEEANKPENSNDPMSLLIKGSCSSLMGDMKTAQESFDQIIAFSDTECSPKIKANALIKKSGVVLSEPSEIASTVEKDLEQVQELLDEALKLDPTNPDAYLHKAQALILAEKFDQAIKDLDRAIELKSDLHSAIAQKFYIQLKMARDISTDSKIQEMLDEFKLTIKKYPDALDLQQMYAQILTEMSLFEQADEVLLGLSRLDPNDGSFYVSRALLQFHLKSDPEEASNLLREALKIDPKIIFAYEVLGSIEIQRGKVEEAIKIFETALKCAQSESEYARCYSHLDSAKCQKASAEALGMTT